MEFADLVKKRRSCDHFIAGEEISDELIEKIVGTAALSPSGYNCQPWEFVVIRDRQRLKALQKIAFDQEKVGDAAAVIVVLADTFIGRNVETLLADWLKFGYCNLEEIPAYRNSIAKNRSFDKRKIMALRSTMMAAMTLIYAAENEGLATCPMMGFSQHQLVDFLEVPEDYVMALMVAIGYPDQDKMKPRLPRKSPDQIIHWEKFGS